MAWMLSIPWEGEGLDPERGGPGSPSALGSWSVDVPLRTTASRRTGIKRPEARSRLGSMPPSHAFDAVEVGIEGNDLRDAFASHDLQADRIGNGQFSPEGDPAVHRRLQEVGVRVPNVAGVAEIVKELQPFTHSDPTPN